MKLHRNLADATVWLLEAVFDHGAVAATALSSTWQANAKWGKRDRAWLAENFYEIVRWRRLLEFAAQSEQPWALLAAQLAKRNIEFPAWPELDAFNSNEIRARLDSDLPRAIRESIPIWLDELGDQELGERWDAEIHALNEEAPVVLRANTLKTTREELLESLRAADIAASFVDEAPDAIQLENRTSLARDWHVGAWEIQDAASQLVAPFLRVEAGQTVIDACAGAGGKTLHLAALLGNGGQIIAFDTHKRKLDELDRRARRAGATNVQSRLFLPQERKRWMDFADRLLIDAPCSGTGTLRRQPDLKWRLTPDFLAQIIERQRKILRTYGSMLKVGGKMVYATCSVLPPENERQIEWFLGENSGFELEETRVISCAETGFDGFFMARLKRIR